jgi:hypothetical protein
MDLYGLLGLGLLPLLRHPKLHIPFLNIDNIDMRKHIVT